MVQVLPILEREMRVAARLPRTWWRRVWVMGLALVVFTFVLMEMGRWATASRLGASIFSGLGGLGMVYALLAGPLATVDCLSRERREGTLGLLFLTPLRSRDVVMGKVAAASLDLVLGLAAAAPVVMLPVLMGGVSLLQFACVFLALLNIMALSLAVGVCASAWLDSGRLSLGLTIVGLLALVFVPILYDEAWLHAGMASSKTIWLYICCPMYVMDYCYDSLSARTIWRYWLSMGAIHGLSWALVLLAVARTEKAWRGLTKAWLSPRWMGRLRDWGQGSRECRKRVRGKLLGQNPIRWLEGRDRFHSSMVWGCLALSWAGYAAGCLYANAMRPNTVLLVLWTAFTHYGLCLWVAMQAPRRFADDKQSGALELLVCTPLSSRNIVAGAAGVLNRRFGWPFFGMVVFALLVLVICVLDSGWGNLFNPRGLGYLLTCGVTVFPMQVYSMARVGMFQGLKHGHSLRASFRLIWWLGVFPWVLFFGVLILLAYLMGGGLSDKWVFGPWIAVHWLVILFWLIPAECQLRFRFRELAAQAGGGGGRGA
jgi:ABC-type transport system involved in cytochrome c biogenesis permease component